MARENQTQGHLEVYVSIGDTMTWRLVWDLHNRDRKAKG